MLLLFFSILACNTSNTKWLIYSLSQHLTRLANDFPASFFVKRHRLPICSYNLFLFWPVTLKSVKKRKKKYLCMCIDKQNQLKKKKVLFWPVTLQTLKGSSTVLVST